MCENVILWEENSDPLFGVADFDAAKSIRIFPNHSDGILTFKISSAIQNAKVKNYSIERKVVFSEQKNLETTSTYDLKHLNIGLYFVSISDEKNTSTPSG